MINKKLAIKYGIPFGIALACVMLFSACDTGLKPADTQTPIETVFETGYGRISVSFADDETAAARTVLPITAYDKYVYTFTKEDETSGVDIAPDSDGFFFLEIGAYTVEVKAYTGNEEPYTLAVRGVSDQFNVGPGINDQVIITLSHVDSEGEGEFSYAITWPADADAVITLQKWSGMQLVDLSSAVTEEDGITKTISLPAGSYVLTVLVTKNDLCAGISEAVHIYPPLATAYAHDFTDDDLVLAQYTVTFDANGATDGTAPSAQTIAAGSGITLPGAGDLSITGYAFGGWNTESDGTGTNYSAGASYVVTGNITLYARWIILCTVSFDVNGGTGTAPASQTIPAGTGVTLPGGTGLSLEGNALYGWNTDADGSGTAYVPGDTHEPQGDITFYAIWDTQGAGTITGATLAQKLDWLAANAQSDSVYPITVSADEGIGPRTLSYSGKTNVFIFLKGDTATRAVNLSANGTLFTIESGVTLTLDDITLRGRSNNANLVRVNSGGALTMNTGSRITGNIFSSNYGGGVYVAADGTFIMNDGEISGNTVSDYGAGVHVYGTFIMNGGDILNNTGSSSSGGGVYVNSGGTFTMTSGKISNNTASSGGGVNISNGTFNMEGGEISGNKAASGGGGVRVYTGTFTMSGSAVISGNTASNGGGVYMEWDGAFNMEGGEIFGNTADWGGGVNLGWANTNKTFTMSDGVIFGNTASLCGGGVYVSGNGSFTKSGGGTIYGYVDGDTDSNTVKNSSDVVQNNQGHAVFVGSNPNKRRESTAGTTVNLNSSVAGYAGGWDVVDIVFNKNNTDDGSIEADPQTITLTDPATSTGTLPVPPTRPNFAFAEWNTAADGSGTAFTETTILTESITIYARWTATVTFDQNNTDTGSAAANPPTMTVTAPATSTETLPEPPTRPNYNFTGWNTAANGSGTAFTEATPVTGNITVYAQWQSCIVPGANLAAKLTWLQTNAISNGVYTIEMTGNDSAYQQSLSYSGRTNVTILIKGDTAMRTINNSNTTFYIFDVKEGVTLILDNNITLQGYNDTYGYPTVYISDGALVMRNGSVVSGGSHGVYVLNGGAFTMEGGKITASVGRGVNMGVGTFTMTGGKISGNSRGVHLGSGTFNMINGEISNNNGSDNGGGVYVDGGTFTMSGGAISGNAGVDGGGVEGRGG
jgi:uncharacterized repeat protein (TIGR02543 family)